MRNFLLTVIIFLGLAVIPFKGFPQEAKTVDDFIKDLDSADRSVQQDAMKHLLADIDKSYPALLTALNNRSYQIKMWAKNLLLTSGKWTESAALTDEIVSSAMKAYNDENRAGEIFSYGLDRFLNSVIPDETKIRFAQGDGRFYSALMAKLQAPPRNNAAILACTYLIGQNDYEAAEDFISATVEKTKDSTYDIALRCACIKALSKLDTPGARAKLLELRNFTDRETISYLSHAFARLHMPEGLAYIAGALKSTDPLVFVNAMTCLRILSNEPIDPAVKSAPQEKRDKIAESWQKWAENAQKTGVIKKPAVALYVRTQGIDELSKKLLDIKAIGEEALTNTRALIDRLPELVIAEKIAASIEDMELILIGLQPVPEDAAFNFIARATLSNPDIKKYLEDSFLIGRDMITKNGLPPVYVVSAGKGYMLFVQFTGDNVIFSSDYDHIRRLSEFKSFEEFAASMDAECRNAPQTSESVFMHGFIRPFELTLGISTTINEMDAYFTAEKMLELYRIPAITFQAGLRDDRLKLTLKAGMKDNRPYNLLRTKPGNRDILKKFPPETSSFILKTIDGPIDKYWQAGESYLKEFSSFSADAAVLDPGGVNSGIFDSLRELSAGTRDNFGFILIDKLQRNRRTGTSIPGTALFCSLDENATLKENFKELSEKLLGVSLEEQEYKGTKFFSAITDDWSWIRQASAIIGNTGFLEFRNEDAVKLLIAFGSDKPSEKPAEKKEPRNWEELFPKEASTLCYIDILTALSFEYDSRMGFDRNPPKGRLPFIVYTIENEDTLECTAVSDIKLYEIVMLLLKMAG